MILVSPGDSRNWIICAKNKTSNHPNGLPDVLLIVASDQIELLDKKIDFLKEKTEDYELISNYLEYGHDLSFFGDESRRGNEHFRFKYNYISEKRLIRGNISIKVFASPSIFPGKFILMAIIPYFLAAII